MKYSLPVAYCLPLLLSSSLSFWAFLSHFLFSSKAYWFWQLSVHHEFSCHWNKNMTHYTTTTQDWVWSDKLSVDVIPLVSLPLNLAQEVGYILSFVTFSCNTLRVYFSLQKGQQACNENVTTSDGRWQMESGYALCIYRWVDGWMMGEERNRVWIAEHYTSRCHESILSHSPAELNLFTTFSPQVTPCLFYKIYCASEQSLQDPYIPFLPMDVKQQRKNADMCNCTLHNRNFKDI